MDKRPIRTMVNRFEGWEFYSSAFDPETGNVVRVVEEKEERFGRLLQAHPRYREDRDLDDRWRKQFDYRYEAFSPVPETIDVQITNYCTVGCSYCYQNSTGKDAHADATKLVDAIFKGLDQAPYQIAFGGGEPCQMPGFEDVLRQVHSLGTVPNFTTSGVFRNKNVATVARDLRSGVALTYHRWRGKDAFEQDYRWWRANVPNLHVHVIADRDILLALQELASIDPTMKVILLAYYADVGRATMKGFMRKQTYNVDLPEMVKQLIAGGMTFAFSEGLLPWALSRPDMGLSMDFVGPQEGMFSCYVDMLGRVSHSSFSGPRHEDETVFNKRLQEIWNRGYWRSSPSGPPCYGCALEPHCSDTGSLHVALCRYQPHNSNDNAPQKEGRYW